MVTLSRRIEVLETKLNRREFLWQEFITSEYLEKNLYFINSFLMNREFFSYEREFFSAGNEVESSSGKNV